MMAEVSTLKTIFRRQKILGGGEGWVTGGYQENTVKEGKVVRQI